MIIYRRKYEPINNLENCIELVCELYETLVFDIQTHILYVIIPCRIYDNNDLHIYSIMSYIHIV